MYIYDISQEVFTCDVYPGDPAPEREVLTSVAAGDVCNLTALRLCAHNGTHIDAPYHFLPDGKTVDALPLDHFIGPCFVAAHEGDLTADHATAILDRACAVSRESARRILIKGQATVTEAAARVFADTDVLLVGNESQTVGPEVAPMAVHLILLGAEVVLLEGIRLGHVPEGGYMLNCAPLNLGGGDGAPCRAILIAL